MILFQMKTLLFVFLLTPALCLTADLTGNWVVRDPLPDGTFRRTYLDLKQDGTKISGHIRSDQFYYEVSESAGGPDEFTLTANMLDGNSARKATYQIKLAGDELHVTARRRPNSPPVEMIAHRTTPGEGAMPARIPLPAIHKVPYNGLAKTPPMGWNSWNKFASRVDDAGVRAAADALVSTGMKDAGYIYVNIDDTWQGERDAQGNIQANKKFPDMKALSAYVHGKGLKIGIYSSPGPNTCAGYEGSHGHEVQDAHTYAAWGIDYLKYDWCGARNMYKDSEMPALYQIMGDALQASGRQILYSLCQYGRDDVWKWGPDVGGNLWRTTGDIRDAWDSMSKIGFSQSDLAPYAAPGHWNDPDMLEIGNGGMSTPEYQTHMSLWALLAAPLLAGNDLQKAPPEILAILTNRDVIAIDQDRAGKQATRVFKSGDYEVWSKELANGEKALGIFNRGPNEVTAAFKWTDAGLKKSPATGRDLWLHQDVKINGNEYSTAVASHGVVLLRVRE
jgi:alpha-galactosidase